jgi:hypothetical protein
MVDVQGVPLERVSYHAVVRFVQRVGPVHAFVPREWRNAEQWAHDTCRAAGTTIEDVQRRVLTPEVRAALCDVNPVDSVRCDGFVAKLKLRYGGEPFVSTIFKTMKPVAAPKAAEHVL